MGVQRMLWLRSTLPGSQWLLAGCSVCAKMGLYAEQARTRQLALKKLKAQQVRASRL